LLSVERLTKEIARGGGIAFLGQIVGKALALLLQFLLTRVLGPAGYGLYALGFSVLGVARMVASLGLQNAVVRFGSMYLDEAGRSRLKGILLLAIGTSLATGVLAAVVLWFLADLIAVGAFDEPNLAAPLRLFSLALPFYTLLIVASHSARVFRRIDYEIIVTQLFRPLLALLVTGVSFLIGYRLIGAVAGFVMSTAMALSLSLFLLHRLFPDLTSRLKSHCEPSRILGFSLTTLLLGLSYLMLTRTDRIMLGVIRSAAEVGVYNAAAVMAEQATLVLLSFNAIFAPIIASLFHQGRSKELEVLFKTTTKWILALTLPVAFVMVLFARPIMSLFGPSFAAGGSLVLISLGLAQLVNASVGPVELMLTMSGRHKLALVNAVTLGGVNVLLNLLLIPRYGVLGAGIATGISISAVNIVKVIEVYVCYKVHPFLGSYWKPLSAGVLAAMIWLGIEYALRPSGWAWLVGVGVFSVTYLLLLLAFKLDGNDKQILSAVIRRLARLWQKGRGDGKRE